GGGRPAEPRREREHQERPTPLTALVEHVPRQRWRSRRAARACAPPRRPGARESAGSSPGIASSTRAPLPYRRGGDGSFRRGSTGGGRAWLARGGLFSPRGAGSGGPPFGGAPPGGRGGVCCAPPAPPFSAGGGGPPRPRRG